ncbi:hypothetical protein HXX76_012320 [Chlamydomonas incerta]|uniref:Uncharacterized protein n=1 Tax=Chlamydomonas incerta TaxID=51695 RepID=A0A835SXH9_CHLIN|nr:hypothetical protein HXX76_012320 [Chlamydomonas incerta]|eukprot:KAG2427671.1 hypothetical protein HXX76_012320 [Chlamydomonas incerta]
MEATQQPAAVDPRARAPTPLLASLGEPHGVPLPPAAEDSASVGSSGAGASLGNSSAATNSRSGGSAGAHASPEGVALTRASVEAYFRDLYRCMETQPMGKIAVDLLEQLGAWSQQPLSLEDPAAPAVPSPLQSHEAAELQAGGELVAQLLVTQEAPAYTAEAAPELDLARLLELDNKRLQAAEQQWAAKQQQLQQQPAAAPAADAEMEEEEGDMLQAPKRRRLQEEVTAGPAEESLQPRQ